MGEKVIEAFFLGCTLSNKAQRIRDSLVAKEISKAAFSKTLAARIEQNHLSLKLETREMKRISASSVGKEKAEV